MDDGFHEVVKLLLKRMKSHPEEFSTGANRWGWMVHELLDHCSEEEAAAIKEGLRPIRLREVHESVMDELLNGDERRRREVEEVEYEKQLAAQARSMLVAQVQAQPRVPSRHPTSSDMEKNGIMNALRNIIK